MIDNIWHMRGSVKLPSDVTDAVICERLEEFLNKQRKPVLTEGNSFISFHSPLWENPLINNNSLALVMYDHGDFWIEPEHKSRVVHYDLRSLHGLVFCLAGALMFFVLFASYQGVAAGLRASLLTFAGLYGGNMLLAWARIPRAIRNVVSGN